MHATEEASHAAALLCAEDVLGAEVAHDFDEGAAEPGPDANAEEARAC